MLFFQFMIIVFLCLEIECCPSVRHIDPCVCSIESRNEISMSCVGEDINDDNINSITDSLTSYMLSNPKLILHSFRIRRTSLTVLQEEVFGLIPFFSLEIYDNPLLNLANLTDNILYSSIHTLKSFYASNNYLIDTEDNHIIKVFGSFPFLEYLTIRDNKIEIIGRKTFNNAEQNLLKAIDLSSNRIAIIEDHAFYQLSSLVYLNLSNNSLVTLNADALALRHWSPKPIQVLLQANQLRADQMTDRLFSQMKRPLILFLQNNKLHFIPEDVFRPIVENETNYLIDFSGNPLLCDCQRHRWLFLLSKNERLKLQNVICGQQSVWYFEEMVSQNCFND